MRRFGVHASIAGGLEKSLERAHALGCTTLQIFSHSPRGWAVQERGEEEFHAFRTLREEYGLSPVFIHTSYLINLASRDSKLLEKSVEMVAFELTIADAIGAEYVVLHTGSAADDAPAAARRRAIRALGEIRARGAWESRILLENTAGERGDITSTVDDLAEIMSAAEGGLIGGVCIDTCHAFAAGHDLRSDEGIAAFAGRIELLVGLDRVRMVHLNDSKGDLGDGIDRHEHIGRGRIGLQGLGRFLAHPGFARIPLILETPKKTDADDRRNLKTLRRLIGRAEARIPSRRS